MESETNGLFACLSEYCSTLIIGGVLVLLFCLYNYRKFSVLSRHGIHGPRPLPLIGNLITFLSADSRSNCNLQYSEFIQKYGKVYGVYFMSIPMVVVLDLDLIQEITVKRFSSFPNHQIFDINPSPVSEGIFFMYDDSWKRARTLVSPTFTGGKLRQMLMEIQRCANVLVTKVEKVADTGESVLIKDIFGAFTMDVIASTAFGIQIDSQSNPDDPFVHYAKNILNQNPFSMIMVLIPAIFPILAPIFKRMKWGYWPRDSIDFFSKTTASLIEDRKQNPSSGRVDFLKLMMDAELNESELHDAFGTSGNTHEKRLSTEEIIGQAFSFFVAGYDTTATLLQFASYVLATHMDIQEQLYQEIHQTLGESEATYDSVKKLTFLDQVVKETLRFYPSLTTLNRGVPETVTVNNITFPKGSTINIPVYRMHHDPDIFPDPEEFIPERFNAENSAKRHPAAFLSFGMGPRQCVGMRLALIEAKIALITVLRKYKFLPCAETEIPLSVNANVGIALLPRKPIKLLIERRN